MKSRDYKFFRQGQYYHIYNRGNNKEGIFLDEQDNKAFLVRLALILNLRPLINKTHIHPLPTNSFSIISYCLMFNHFHILIRQNGAISISALMSKLSTSYAKYLNARYKKLGNIFQDTFKSRHIDNDSYLTYLSAYIHNNPIDPLAYPYSSMQEYLNMDGFKICDTDILLKYFDSDVEKYKNFVEVYTFRDHQKIQHLTFED